MLVKWVTDVLQQPKSSWKLQMSWHQMGIRPSVNNHNDDCDFDYNVTWNPSCNMVIRSQLLTHLPLVCVGELGQHWFRKWLVAWSVASHYLNQCLGTNFSEMQIRNAKLFIHQNALRNVILEMAATLTGGGVCGCVWVCVCVCVWGGGGGGGWAKQCFHRLGDRYLLVHLLMVAWLVISQHNAPWM